MDDRSFDTLARLIGSGRSRRHVLKTLVGGAAGAIAAVIGLDRAEASSRLRSVGNSCNSNADCASGLCVNESHTRNICHCARPADCPQPGDLCHAATCVAGACGFAVNAGASCDDGKKCTTGDVCQADGSCAGTAISCTPLDQCHTPGVCNPQTGACSNPPKPNGSICNDGNACTISDVCTNGVCAGAAISCAPPNQCHQPGTCSPQTGLCSYIPKPNGTPCDDGDSCTANDVCANGVCAGTAVSCVPSPGDCYQPGVCDPQTGQCSWAPRLDGTPCDDGNSCTFNDSCQAGVCEPGTTLVCSVPNECFTPGTCDPQTGLCSAPVFRGEGEVCSIGACHVDFCCVADHSYDICARSHQTGFITDSCGQPFYCGYACLETSWTCDVDFPGDCCSGGCGPSDFYHCEDPNATHCCTPD